MQTVDSFPLMSSVKCLLERLMTLRGHHKVVAVESSLHHAEQKHECRNPGHYSCKVSSDDVI